jgi:hypothetical protein
MKDDPLFGALQFTVNEIQSVLELDVSKGAGSNGVPALILKNCASVFERLSLLFNRSLWFILMQRILQRIRLQVCKQEF